MKATKLEQNSLRLTDGVDSEIVGWLDFFDSRSCPLEFDRLLSTLWLALTRELHAFFTVSMNLEPGPESLLGVPGTATKYYVNFDLK